MKVQDEALISAPSIEEDEIEETGGRVDDENHEDINDTNHKEGGLISNEEDVVEKHNLTENTRQNILGNLFSGTFENSLKQLEDLLDDYVTKGTDVSKDRVKCPIEDVLTVFFDDVLVIERNQPFGAQRTIEDWEQTLSKHARFIELISGFIKLPPNCHLYQWKQLSAICFRVKSLVSNSPTLNHLSKLRDSSIDLIRHTVQYMLKDTKNSIIWRRLEMLLQCLCVLVSSDQINKEVVTPSVAMYTKLREQSLNKITKKRHSAEFMRKVPDLKIKNSEILDKLLSAFRVIKRGGASERSLLMKEMKDMDDGVDQYFSKLRVTNRLVNFQCIPPQLQSEMNSAHMRIAQLLKKSVERCLEVDRRNHFFSGKKVTAELFGSTLSELSALGSDVDMNIHIQNNPIMLETACASGRTHVLKLIKYKWPESKVIFKSRRGQRGETQEQTEVKLKLCQNKEFCDLLYQCKELCIEGGRRTQGWDDIENLLNGFRSLVYRYDRRGRLLQNLAECLRKDQNIRILEKRLARIPLIRISYYHNIGEVQHASVQADITIDSVMPYHNSLLLKCYSKWMAKARYLMLIVKHWAKSKEISDASRGYLSSYTWNILVVFFLQQRGILPCLHKTLTYSNGDKIDRKYVTLRKTWNTDTMEVDDLSLEVLALDASKFSPLRTPEVEETLLIRLFRDFLIYYVYEFDWKSHSVSIREGVPIPRSHNISIWRWSIEDPYENFHSVAPRDLGVVLLKQSMTKLFYHMKKALVCAINFINIKDSKFPFTDSYYNKECIDCIFEKPNTITNIFNNQGLMSVTDIQKRLKEGLKKLDSVETIYANSAPQNPAMQHHPVIFQNAIVQIMGRNSNELGFEPKVRKNLEAMEGKRLDDINLKMNLSQVHRDPTTKNYSSVNATMSVEPNIPISVQPVDQYGGRQVPKGKTKVKNLSKPAKWKQQDWEPCMARGLNPHIANNITNTSNVGRNMIDGNKNSSYGADEGGGRDTTDYRKQFPGLKNYARNRYTSAQKSFACNNEEWNHNYQNNSMGFQNGGRRNSTWRRNNREEAGGRNSTDIYIHPQEKICNDISTGTDTIIGTTPNYPGHGDPANNLQNNQRQQSKPQNRRKNGAKRKQNNQKG